MNRTITLLFLFFVSCSAPTITANYDESVNFKLFQTYSFVTYENISKPVRTDYNNPENRELVSNAISEQLTSLGYTLAENKADLSVVFDIIITEMVDPRVDSAVIYKPWVDTKIDSFNYTEGLLVVRLIDAEHGKMVWQGSLSGILNKDADKFGKNMDVYIRKLFSSLATRMQ